MVPPSYCYSGIHFQGCEICLTSMVVEELTLTLRGKLDIYFLVWSKVDMGRCQFR